MLVKGGSSFNALVRAMKQDLIDSGTAAKDPALLYEIDKVGGVVGWVDAPYLGRWSVGLVIFESMDTLPLFLWC